MHNNNIKCCALYTDMYNVHCSCYYHYYQMHEWTFLNYFLRLVTLKQGIGRNRKIQQTDKSKTCTMHKHQIQIQLQLQLQLQLQTSNNINFIIRSTNNTNNNNRIENRQKRRRSSSSSSVGRSVLMLELIDLDLGPTRKICTRSALCSLYILCICNMQSLNTHYLLFI